MICITKRLYGKSDLKYDLKHGFVTLDIISKLSTIFQHSSAHTSRSALTCSECVCV
jgi:hypothetical protein